MLFSHKKEEVLIHAITWMSLENITSESTKYKRSPLHDFLYMKYSEKANP